LGWVEGVSRGLVDRPRPGLGGRIGRIPAVNGKRVEMPALAAGRLSHGYSSDCGADPEPRSPGAGWLTRIRHEHMTFAAECCSTIGKGVAERCSMVFVRLVVVSLA